MWLNPWRVLLPCVPRTWDVAGSANKIIISQATQADQLRFQNPLNQRTQQLPHAAWSLTGLSARVPRQSTVAGSIAGGTAGACSRAERAAARVGCGARLRDGSTRASYSSCVQSANLLTPSLHAGAPVRPCALYCVVGYLAACAARWQHWHLALPLQPARWCQG